MAELRIGDADRESAVAALGEHYAQGRLTKDEYDERSDVAWSARTAADLRPLFVDLPASTAGPVAQAHGSGTPATAPAPRRREVPWKALLIALAVIGVITHGKLVLLALVLWFVLARRRAVPHPPWVHRGPGGTPPPPWGQRQPWSAPPPWGRRDRDAGGHGR